MAIRCCHAKGSLDDVMRRALHERFIQPRLLPLAFPFSIIRDIEQWTSKR
jgi:hypothetical protein